MRSQTTLRIDAPSTFLIRIKNLVLLILFLSTSTSYGQGILAEPNTHSGCAGVQIQYTFTYSGGGYVQGINWTVEPANAANIGDASLQTTTVTWLADGILTVEYYEVINGVGTPRSTPTSFDVYVAAAGSILITASDAAICAGESVTLTASGGVDYEWNGPGVANLQQNSITISPENTSQYTVTGYATGCYNQSQATQTITVSAIPQTPADDALTFCEWQNPTPETSEEFAGIYNWYNADGTLFGSGKFLNHYFRPGTYSFDVEAVSEAGCVSAARGNIDLTIITDCDNDLNWIEAKAYNSDGAIYSHSKSFFDFAGRPLQTQTKQFSHTGSGSIFATQDLRDRYDRVVGSTLPAPIQETAFKYDHFFVENESSERYSEKDFDDPSSNTVYQPLPVDDDTQWTLGWYYSGNNTLEDHVPITRYPYSRTEFYEEGTGEVKRSASPGDQHRLGMGHEILTGTFPVSNELDDYLVFRRELELPDNKTNNTLRNEGIQTVVRDENGKYAISITDKSGKTVMAARKGTSGNNVLAITNEVIANVNPDLPDYRPLTYFYILDDQSITITPDPTPGITTDYTIEDIVSGLPYTPPANGIWAAGFYRIILNSGSISFNYTNYYLDVSYQFYDDVGRLTFSVSPNGFVQWKNGLSLFFIDKTRYEYNHRGWLLSMTEPDAGKTEYVYRKDGKIRFSQNAQQRIESHFSYTHYDKLGRPIESGEYVGTGMAFKSTEMMNMLEYDAQVIWGNDEAEFVRDWVKTHYDIPDPNENWNQQFVRGAVSWTENRYSKTWYTYDELGRVIAQYQRILPINLEIQNVYSYDFLGNLLASSYDPSQGNKIDYLYEYDEDKRLKNVQFKDLGSSGNFKTIAQYDYYLHGPLKRIELGDKLQGIDFVYNINGWLTQINHPDTNNDPGGDGNTGNHSEFRKDAFGMLLDYYESQMGVFEGAYTTPKNDPNRFHKLPSIQDQDNNDNYLNAFVPTPSLKFTPPHISQGLEQIKEAIEKQKIEPKRTIGKLLDEPVENAICGDETFGSKARSPLAGNSAETRMDKVSPVLPSTILGHRSNEMWSSIAGNFAWALDGLRAEVLPSGSQRVREGNDRLDNFLHPLPPPAGDKCEPVSVSALALGTNDSPQKRHRSSEQEELLPFNDRIDPNTLIASTGNRIYSTPAVVFDGNGIQNHEFDQGTANWNLYDWTGATASTWSVVQNASLSGANAAHVDIKNTDNSGWKIQLQQPLGFTLEQSKTYEISFIARAESPRRIRAAFSGSPSNTEYWNSGDVNLTTNAQIFGPFSYTCNNANVANETSFNFKFYLAYGTTSDVWIDKVIIVDKTSGSGLVAGMNVTPLDAVLSVGQSTLLAKTILPTNAANQNVTWSSSNTSVATVNSSGLVTAVSAGTSTVTATSVDGGYTGSSSITVLSVGSNSVRNPEFDEGKNRWTFYDWSGPNNSNGGNIFSIVQNAGLSGSNAAYLDIVNTNSTNWTIALRNDFDFKIEQGHTYEISFKAKAESPRPIDVGLRGNTSGATYWSQTANVTATPQTFGPYFYTCNDANVANEATFRLMFYLAKGVLSDVWLDNVSIRDITRGPGAVAAVTVSPTSVILAAGQSKRLAHSIIPADATNQNVTWSSGNPSVATVNSAGLVTALSAGTATITVTTEDGGFTASSAFTVLSAGSNTLKNHEFDSDKSFWVLNDYTGPNNSNGGNTFSVVQGAGLSGNNAAYIDVINDNNSGWTLQFAQSLDFELEQGHTYEISFTSKAESNRPLEVALRGSSGNYWNANVNLTTTTQTFGPFLWTCDDAGVLRDPGFAVVFYLAEGIISDVWIDNVIVKDVTGTPGAVIGVNVSPTAVTLAAGQSKKLTHTVSPPDANNLNVTWSSSNPSVATVNSAGLVTALSAGTATITVITEDGGFTALSAFTVLPAGSNTLKNHEFDNDKSHWVLNDYTGPNNSNGGNTFSIVQGAGLSGNNAAYIDIVNDNNSGWTLQFLQALDFELEQGHTYEISFTSKAESNRPLEVALRGSSDNYWNANVNLTTVPQSFGPFYYTCNNAGVLSDPGFALIFYLSEGVISDVWVDNVIVKDVTGAPGAVLGVNISPSAVTFAAGQIKKLTHAVFPPDATNQNVTWASSNPSVATVSNAGLVTGAASGSATITVTTEDGDHTASSSFTVLSPGSNTLKNHEFDNDKNYWTLYDYTGPNNSSGGNTLSIVQGAGLSGNNAAYIDIVNNNNSGWTLQFQQQLDFELEQGHTYEVSFTSKAESNRPLEVALRGSTGNYWNANVNLTATTQTFGPFLWTCDNAGVLTDPGFAVVFYLAEGLISDVWIDNVVVRDVTNIPVTGVNVSPSTLTLTVGQSGQLTKSVLPVNATNQNVTWTSGNTSVATVNSEGLVAALSTGTTSITVTTLDGAFSALASVTVDPGQGLVPDSIEFAALKDLYDSLGGINWTFDTNWPTVDNWPTSASNEDYGTWQGVTVRQGDVVKLDLRNVTEKIPSSIKYLERLECLTLNGSITGVPQSINELMALHRLEISGFRSGFAVFPDISGLTQLDTLSLRSNAVYNPEGSELIPSWIGDFVNLRKLVIFRMARNGAIPDEIGNLVNLRYLDLRSNWLSGSIPAAIGNLVNLESVSLGNNQLSGEIPSSISSLQNLKVLYLNNNTLMGSIPLPNGSFSSLETLNLSYNQYASFPQFPASMTALKNLNLSYNHITGNIHESIGNLTGLVSFNCDGNMISGLPLSIGQLTNLQSLSLTGNQITALPSTIGQLALLQTLNLGSNLLTTLPADVNQLSNLVYLTLNANKLTSLPDLSGLQDLTSLNIRENPTLQPGPVQAWIQNLTSLFYLYLDNTNRTGSIPDWLGDLPFLYSISLKNNQLTGSVPGFIGNPMLSGIDLSYNNLTGNIPESILTNTDYLWIDLSHNNLTGGIPMNWVASPEWGLDIDLSHNQLSGDIPDIFQNWIYSYYIDLSNNQFTGTVPPSLGVVGFGEGGVEYLDSWAEINLSNNRLTAVSPEFWAAVPKAYSIKLDSNLLKSLPDIQSTSISTELSLTNNFLDFSTLERFVDKGFNLIIAPQKKINDVTSLPLAPGSLLEIGARPMGQHSQTVWEKQQLDGSWINLNSINEDQTNHAFRKSNTTLEDLGNYRWRMTNSILTDLTLESELISVIGSDPPPAQDYRSQALYNGIISSVTWRTDKVYQSTEEDFSGTYLYDYDEKYQIKEANFAKPIFGTMPGYTMQDNQFRLTGMSYDPNGNIMTLKRYNDQSLRINDFTYHYQNSFSHEGGQQMNRLMSVYGHAPSYEFNAIGQMIRQGTNSEHVSLPFATGAGLEGGEVHNATLQPDGKILLGGNFTSYDGEQAVRIVRLNQDGSKDATFVTGSGFNSKVDKTLVQADGKIIVGGTFTEYNGSTAIKITRLNEDGSLDNSFTTGTGLGTGGGITWISLQADGKILFAGAFTSYNGTSTNRILRLNPDGSIDNSFVTGTGFNGTTNCVRVQPDGKILASGSFTSYNGTPANRIIRLNSDGSIDNSFVYGTGFSVGYVEVMLLQPDGKIVAVGQFATYRGTASSGIVRILPNGDIDPSFMPGSGFNAFVRDAELQADGKIVAGGDFTSYNNAPVNYVVRLNTNGTIDWSFNAGTGTNSLVIQVLMVQTSKILLAGYFTSYNGTSVNRVVLLNGDGSISTTNSSTSGETSYQSVKYDVTGKVKEVYKGEPPVLALTYLYDDRGFRLAKVNHETQRTTWYMRDASGNILSVYEQEGVVTEESTENNNDLIQTEIPVYGSGKIGTYYPRQDGSLVYELTDHLGNVRALLRDNISIYTATMENSGQADNPRDEELLYFENITETEVADERMNHTLPMGNVVPNPDKSAYLYWVDGVTGMDAADKSIGPAIALKVNAGDKVEMETWARYEEKVSYEGLDLAALASMLGGTFTNVQGFEGYTQAQTSSSLLGALNAAQYPDGSDNTRPNAYLNYVIYDDEMIYQDAGWVRVPADAGFEPGQEANPNHDKHKEMTFSSPVEISQNGYIYIWVSNESEATKVWFDDLKVTLTQHMVTQATDYGVWGDVIREQKSDESLYRFGYQGRFAEKDEETGWNHFELREYDPVIGRWMVVDPERQYASPYVAFGNNPVNQVDPDGGTAGDPNESALTIPFSVGFAAYRNQKRHECGCSNPSFSKSYVGEFVNGFGGGAKFTWEGIKSQFTPENLLLSTVLPLKLAVENINTVVGLWNLGTRVSEEFSSYDSYDFTYAGGFVVEKVAEILVLKYITTGGPTFSQYKASYWSARVKPSYQPIRLTNGKVFKVFEELHHRFIPNRWTWAPNWLKNNRFNLQPLNSIRHGIKDPYRFNFFPKEIKEAIRKGDTFGY